MIQYIVIIVATLAMYFLQRKLYEYFWAEGLEVELKFQSGDLFEGNEGYLREVIVNDKWLPLPLLNIKFQTDKNLTFSDAKISEKTDQYYRNDVFRIGARKKVTRTLRFKAEKRGVYGINGIDIHASDLFMSSYFKASQQEDMYFYVYPRPFYSKDFLHCLQMVNGQLQTKRQYLEDPFEYRGIREYQPYDDMKSINWKATAKTGDFKVNLHDFTAVKSVRIFLNLEDDRFHGKADCAEACIRIATGICRFFSDKGMKVSCYANTRDKYGSGIALDEKRTLQEVYRALAGIDINGDTQDFAKIYRNRMLTENKGEFTFVISMNAYDDFVELLHKYHLVSGDFIWFYPYQRKLDFTAPGELESCFRPINISYIS